MRCKPVCAGFAIFTHRAYSVCLRARHTSNVREPLKNSALRNFDLYKLITYMRKTPKKWGFSDPLSASITHTETHMDPVFTLQWPEFLLAEQLQAEFPKSKNFSVLVPTSRQEKGIDLALVHKRKDGASRVALLQVKASRTYTPAPPKRSFTRHYKFHTWFNTFEPSDQADFFLLIGMYAPDSARTLPVAKDWYKDITLMFTYTEMKEFLDSCKTVKGEKDGKFGFGFNNESKIEQTRGDQERRYKDYTSHLLKNRISTLRKHIDA
jgi:hypothetical protein